MSTEKPDMIDKAVILAKRLLPWVYILIGFGYAVLVGLVIALITGSPE